MRGVTIIEKLIEGFRTFRETYFEQNRELFDALAKGQSPRVMVISCCDSRVDPGLIFGTAPGEIFVVRNVANLVPPYKPDSQYHGTSAALEFAVRSLKVSHIVVMGHAHCGGVRALLEGTGDSGSDFVNAWMDIAAPARNRALWRANGQPQEVIQQTCEHETVGVSLDNLITFPWILEAVEAGTLKLHGLYFDMDNGQLLKLDRKNGGFHPVD